MIGLTEMTEDAEWRDGQLFNDRRRSRRRDPFEEADRIMGDEPGTMEGLFPPNFVRQVRERSKKPKTPKKYLG